MLPKNINELNILNEQREKVLGYKDNFLYSGKDGSGYRPFIMEIVNPSERKIREQIEYRDENLVFPLYWDIVKKVMESADWKNMDFVQKKETIEKYYIELAPGLSEEKKLNDQRFRKFRNWAFKKVGTTGPSAFEEEAKKMMQMNIWEEATDIYDSIVKFCNCDGCDEDKLSQRKQKINEALENAVDCEFILNNNDILKNKIKLGTLFLKYRDRIQSALANEEGGRKRKRRRKSRKRIKSRKRGKSRKRKRKTKRKRRGKKRSRRIR